MGDILLQSNKDLPINRFIIPFAYDEKDDFKTFIEKLIQRHPWEICSLFGEDIELYEHTTSLVAQKLEDIDNAIGVALKKTGTDDIRIVPAQTKAANNFRIKNVQLVLFKTNVGFLILDTDYSNINSLSDVIDINNKLRSIKKKDNLCFVDEEKTEFFKFDEKTKLESSEKENEFYLITDNTTADKGNSKLYIQKKTLPASENDIIELRTVKKDKKRLLKCNYITRKKFDFRLQICNWLKGINISTFFIQAYSKDNECFLPSKANYFGCVVIKHNEGEEEQILDAFFKLRKAYNENYSSSSIGKDIYNNPEVYRPFEDVFWGMSREGIANLTYHTNTFIPNNKNRLETYFYLYILVLHQYYGLLLLAKETSSLPSKVESYNNDKEYNKLKSIQDRINFFYLKCIFNEVTHITHQAELYKRMFETLGIENMLRELNYETEKLTLIADKIREAEQDKRRKLYLIVGSIFTFVTTLQAIWTVCGYGGKKAINSLNIFENVFANEILTIFCIQIILCLLGVLVYLFFRLLNYKKK